MTRNSRELSQFASFIDIKDANQNIGVITSMVINPGGIGIGSPVSDYLNEVSIRGAVDPLINWNKTFLLNDVLINGEINVEGSDISITSAGATFPSLNVNGLTTTRDLVVTGVTTLSRDTGMGTVYIGQPDVIISGAQGTASGSNANIGVAVTGPGGAGFADDTDLAHGLVVIDNVGAADPNEVALYVSGKVHFNGGDPLINDPINGGETGLGTEFVVVPKALYYDKVTFLEGLNIVKQGPIPASGPEGGSAEPVLKVFNDEFGAVPGVAETENGNKAAIWTNGGFEAKQYGRIGYALSIGEYVEIGRNLPTSNTDHTGSGALSVFEGDIAVKTVNVTIGIATDDIRYLESPNNRTNIDLQTSTLTTLYPYISDDPAESNAGIGTEQGRFSIAYLHDLEVGPDGSDSQVNMVNLNVSLGSTMAYLDVAGTGGTDEDEIYLDVGPGKSRFANIESFGSFNHTGIATINTFLNVISDSFNNAYVATAFQAQNVDVYKQDETNSTDPEFFYPAMANAGISQTDVGAQLFVNPGFYLDAFGTSLFIHNNLNVLGTSINASLENPELRFDLLNYGVTELNLASQARYIDIGEPESSEGGITSIRSELTELVRLRLKQNDIQASTGDTAITLNEDINVNIAGWIQIGGTYIKCDQNDINIADTPLRGDLFKSAPDVIIGAEDLGIASIRNNVTEVEFLRINKNAVQASDESTAFTIGLAGTHISFTGDIIVGGSDIQTGFGITNITMIGDTKTILYGDLEIRGNEILSSDGSVNILMFDAQELTSFTGAIRIEGDEIRAGTGDTNITMNSNQFTRFAGAIQVDGDVIRASNGQDNITMDSDLLTTVSGDLQVGTGTMRAGDGTICISMEGGTGSVAISSDVSANSAFFNGLEARLNVQDVDIRDNLLRIGLIEDPTAPGTLIPPNVAIGNTGDVGLVMARYDVGLSTHKYAAIYYDNSEGRVAIRTDVEDAGIGAGRDRYLLNNGLPSELEVKNLYVTNTSSLGIKTIFESNTRDDGENITEVLNVVNVEIDAGVFA